MADKNCFRCDGSGRICNICGESAAACGCDEVEIEEYAAEFASGNLDDCPDCSEDE